MKRNRHSSHRGRQFGPDGNRAPMHYEVSDFGGDDDDDEFEEEDDEDPPSYLSWGLDQPTHDRGNRHRGPRSTRYAKWDDDEDDEDGYEDYDDEEE